MVFTSQIFLFIFFPICFLSYFFVDRISKWDKVGFLFRKLRIKDIVLIIFSLGFYAWAFIPGAKCLLVYIAAVYLLGLLTRLIRPKSKDLDKRGIWAFLKRKIVGLIFALLVMGVLSCLVYYNYLEFLITSWNDIFKTDFGTKFVFAPLGISFITFSAISYLTDIYRSHATAGSIIDCALYLSFFPKVISGPIVLWKDFQGQIKTREMSFDFSADGINRIMIGFGKKVLLADVFGTCLSKIPIENIDRFTALGILVLYMLQIYFDFSGYSDIAIGLAKLLGFEFKENFVFPYCSTSVSEFWRRWHVSLGTWFREYVYFPLGGNRKGKLKTLLNLAIVFALTGIWHGAGWNYILWGAINGVFVIVEHMMKGKTLYEKTPAFIKYVVTMVIVMMFWQLFKYQDINDAFAVYGIALGRISFSDIIYTWRYYFDNQIIALACAGVIVSTLPGLPKIQEAYGKFVSYKAGYFVQELVLIALFVLAIIFTVNATYSPFLYFRY